LISTTADTPDDEDDKEALMAIMPKTPPEEDDESDGDFEALDEGDVSNHLGINTRLMVLIAL
jgi:hypothetical protein